MLFMAGSSKQAALGGFASLALSAAIGVIALSAIQCGSGSDEAANDPFYGGKADASNQGQDGSSTWPDAGTVPNGLACQDDQQCQSTFCEVLADGSGKMACAATACKECEGLDGNGACVPLADNLESATCAGSCSTSYGSPTGVKKCCASACACTETGVCQ